MQKKKKKKKKMLTAVSMGFSNFFVSGRQRGVRHFVYIQSTGYQTRSQGFSLFVRAPPLEGKSPGIEGYPNPILLINYHMVPIQRIKV